MTDYIGIGWNPATEKWAITVFVKDFDTMDEAKRAVKEWTPKIAAAFKDLRDDE